MKEFHYSPSGWPGSARLPEWSLGNGIGGYAAGTITGLPARRHHGLLVASLHPPVERQMVLEGLSEEIETSDGHFSLSDYFEADGQWQNGRQWLTDFCWDGLPRWQYHAGGLSLAKTLAPVRGENAVAIAYTAIAQKDAVLTLSPRFCWRAAGDAGNVANSTFHVQVSSSEAVLSPADAPEWSICLRWSAGVAQPLQDVPEYPVLSLPTEIETGDPVPETSVVPFRLRVTVAAGQTLRFSVVCFLEKDGENAAEAKPQKRGWKRIPCDAFAVVAAEKARQAELLNAGKPADDAQRWLMLAADQFLVRRASTGGDTLLAGLPWFTDWGRDTMIAFEGVCLVPHRLAEACSVLQSFAEYEKDGLIPNLFPDEGSAPLYNTADGSLWYFCAVYRYLQYDTTPQGMAFVREKLWPSLQHILECHCRGTHFSIGRDPADGLLNAGSGLDQVTWMDVRVGDRVMTPRHGKPVEINALWYAALQIAAWLATQFDEGDTARRYIALAETVRQHFAGAFWNPDAGCLYDVIGPEGPDATLRPNQLMAISLWHCLPPGAPPLLSPAQEKAVVDVVAQKLYIGPGIRTLPPDDPNYHGHYVGPLAARDEAYHQGTAWGWLLGEFLFAHARVYDGQPGENARLQQLVQPALATLAEGGISGIAELFDAEPPHLSRGCFSQAWSVGEVLAALAVLGLNGDGE